MILKEFKNDYIKNVEVKLINEGDNFVFILVDGISHFMLKHDREIGKYFSYGFSEYLEGLETGYFDSANDALIEALRIAKLNNKF